MAVYTLDRGLVLLGTMVVGPLTILIMGSITMLLAVSIGIGFPLVWRIP